MPSITQEKRDKLNPSISALKKVLEDEDEGAYNYVISCLIHNFVLTRELRYVTLNAAIGILEAAKIEFTRAILNLYEKKKEEKNGVISELSSIVNSL